MVHTEGPMDTGFDRASIRAGLKRTPGSVRKQLPGNEPEPEAVR